jgi:hypothetical protein
MPTAKHRKNHKKKAQSFKTKQQDNKRRSEKFQRELVMKLIEQEKQKGLFDNTPSVNSITSTVDGPQIDLTQGPLI